MLLSEILQVIPEDVSITVVVGFDDSDKPTEYYHPHSIHYSGMPKEWINYRVLKIYPSGYINSHISIQVEEIEQC